MNDANLNLFSDARQDPPDEVVQIVQRLEPTLGELSGPVSPLEGGITNRNYRACLGDMEYVIRVPGKDTNLLEIDRRAEVLANERAASLGVAPPVAAALTDPPAIVTEFVEGEGMSPEELREPDVMKGIAESLKRIHDSEGEVPTTFDSFRIVETYARTADERGAEIPDAYDEAHANAQRIEKALSGAEHDPVPCHNDLLAANFIRGEKNIWIVDWEYAGMGDRYFDLANFAINNELSDADEDRLLHAYFGEPAAPAQVSALALMKFMSDFREAMWGVVQSAVSEIDFDFREYATKHFDRMAATAADEGFERRLNEAGGG